MSETIQKQSEKIEDLLEGLNPITSYITLLEILLQQTMHEDFQGYVYRKSFNKFAFYMTSGMKQSAMKRLKEMGLLEE